MSQGIIDNPTPLKPAYVPTEFPYRDDESTYLQSVIEDESSTGPQTVLVQGPRGTGKTHLCLHLLNQYSNSMVTCYVPCHECNTQYKALKQLYRAVTEEEPADGNHTAALQRTIEERTQAVPVVLVLDELDFLLQNDGNDLLYYLSRLDTDLTLLLISSTKQDIDQYLEPRTVSSLQADKLELEHYTSEQRYNILADRARKALSTQSVHRQALTHIASNTPNLSLGLHWLKTAAQQTSSVVTESVVKDSQTDAYQYYITHLLDGFTDHHELVFNAVRNLSTEQEKQAIQSGTIYDKYNDLCSDRMEEPLSNRRISDYLKHLELLKLVDAKYHYGGRTGKTREIKLTKPW